MYKHMEMEMEAMSGNTIFERLGVEYEERDGIFYPLISAGTEVVSGEVGKYGRMWIRYMKLEYPVRYRSLVRFSELNEKALDVNEYAYKLLTDIEEAWLKKHKPQNSNSFTEMYRLRSQARMIAEEVVMHDIVNQVY